MTKVMYRKSLLPILEKNTGPLWSAVEGGNNDQQRLEPRCREKIQNLDLTSLRKCQ